jgi:hypothetical protein
LKLIDSHHHLEISSSGSEPITDTLIVVIDALDECSNRSSEIRLFLEQICNCFSTNSIPLKVFVTSRPEDVISRIITPLEPSSPSDWSVVQHPRYRKVTCAGRHQSFRLSELASTSGMGQGTSVSSSVSTQLIDELYRAILKRAFGKKNTEEKQVARMVLKLVICAQTPLTIDGIVEFLNALPDVKMELLVNDIRCALELLPSVISTPV